MEIEKTKNTEYILGEKMRKEKTGGLIRKYSYVEPFLALGAIALLALFPQECT